MFKYFALLTAFCTVITTIASNVLYTVLQRDTVFRFYSIYWRGNV